MKKKLSIAFLLIFLIQACRSIAVYEPGQAPTFQTFEEYYTSKLEKSKQLKARPGNEEKLIRIAPGKTPFAILYIHGFGASRAEGEEIVDKISAKLQANTYYLRLPGHGTNPEDHRDTEYTALLEESRIALMMTKQLGEKVVVIGTSMGGLIGTHLAANYPNDVNALVLVSPFFDFDIKISRLANLYGGMTFLELVLGKIRESGYKTSSPERKEEMDPAHDNFWYATQYFAALGSLNDLRRAASTEENFRKITSPTLLLYYYKNELHRDTSANVGAMREAFYQFPSTKMKHSKNRIVNVIEGSHVLMSKYVRTDKDYIFLETEDFLKNVFLKK